MGVIAQDLLESHPKAIHVDNYGFYMVDYEQLGLRMMTLDEWNTINDNELEGAIQAAGDSITKN